MRKQDWSLVLFTTLTQLSVGMVLCLTALAYFTSDTSAFFATGLNLKNPMLLAFIFVGIATTVSFLHLGRPANAPRALNNLSGSWLSREILALGLYSMCLLVLLALGWEQGSLEHIKYLLPFNTVLGLILLWMMIQIYTVVTIPAWNSWYTGLSFVSTTVCLGLVAMLVLYVFDFLHVTDWVVGKIVMVLIAVLLIEIISAYSNQSRLTKMNTGIENLVFDQGLFYRIFRSRIALLIIAVLALLVLTNKPGLLSGTGFYPWVLLLMVLVFVQEIMGRFLFYSSYFRTGV